MVVKAEAIYEGGTYELTRNNQTGNYYAQVRAKKREPPTDEPYSYYPVMLRVTDDAGNVSIYTISDALIGDNLLLIVREEQIFPLKFIVANENGEELGFVKDANLIDLEIGDTNDFELELSADAWSPEMYNWGYRIFIPGTEYGGLLEDRKTSTSSNTVTWMGYTWRGLLSQKIIQPPEGEAYLTVSGDANEIISEVLGDRFGPLFVADEDPAGIQISNFQFDRYCTLLDGLDKMLAGAGARLKIYYQQGDPGGMNGAVHLCAVPVTDWSDELEYSQDGKLNFTTRDYRRGINHLICAGSGEQYKKGKGPSCICICRKMEVSEKHHSIPGWRSGRRCTLTPLRKMWTNLRRTAQTGFWSWPITPRWTPRSTTWMWTSGTLSAGGTD